MGWSFKHPLATQQGLGLTTERVGHEGVAAKHGDKPCKLLLPHMEWVLPNPTSMTYSDRQLTINGYWYERDIRYHDKPSMVPIPLARDRPYYLILDTARIVRPNIEHQQLECRACHSFVVIRTGSTILQTFPFQLLEPEIDNASEDDRRISVPELFALCLPSRGGLAGCATLCPAFNDLISPDIVTQAFFDSTMVSKVLLLVLMASIGHIDRHERSSCRVELDMPVAILIDHGGVSPGAMFACTEEMGERAIDVFADAFRQSKMYHMYCQHIGKPVQVALASTHDAEDRAPEREDFGGQERCGFVESAVTVEPAEAACISDVLWAASVERRISENRQADVHRYISHPCPKRRYVLLEFGRDPPEFDSVLLNSEVAHAAIERGAELQPDWANGAKLFVEGVGPEFFDVHLCPRHVLVFAEDEALVHAVLRKLPYNFRPRLKPGSGRREVSEFALLGCSVSSEGDHDITNDAQEVIPYTVKNGFIHIEPDTEVATHRSWP